MTVLYIFVINNDYEKQVGLTLHYHRMMEIVSTAFFMANKFKCYSIGMRTVFALSAYKSI